MPRITPSPNPAAPVISDQQGQHVGLHQGANQGQSHRGPRSAALGNLLLGHAHQAQPDVAQAELWCVPPHAERHGYKRRHHHGHVVEVAGPEGHVVLPFVARGRTAAHGVVGARAMRQAVATVASSLSGSKPAEPRDAERSLCILSAGRDAGPRARPAATYIHPRAAADGRSAALPERLWCGTALAVGRHRSLVVGTAARPGRRRVRRLGRLATGQPHLPRHRNHRRQPVRVAGHRHVQRRPAQPATRQDLRPHGNPAGGAGAGCRGTRPGHWAGRAGRSAQWISDFADAATGNPGRDAGPRALARRGEQRGARVHRTAAAVSPDRTRRPDAADRAAGEPSKSPHRSARGSQHPAGRIGGPAGCRRHCGARRIPRRHHQVARRPGAAGIGIARRRRRSGFGQRPCPACWAFASARRRGLPQDPHRHRPLGVCNRRCACW